MEKYIAEFPQHLRHAIKIASQIKLNKISEGSFDKIIICGMGGSGIGATIVKNYLLDKSDYPIEVIKEYRLPKYTDSRSLIILSSYSGNTEEAKSCYEEALTLTSNIIIISSGGYLVEASGEKNIDLFLMPESFQPRAALGYSVVMLLSIMNKIGVLGDSVNDEIMQTADFLDQNSENIKSEARDLSMRLHNTIPVIYAESIIEGVAIRWRQQINENSKMLCYHHTVPEMNHNELVALKNAYPNMYVILLRHTHEYYRNVIRFDFCEDKLKEYNIPYSSVSMVKDSILLEQIFGLILTGDWLSFYLSEIQKVDSEEVKVIDDLKEFLSNK